MEDNKDKDKKDKKVFKFNFNIDLMWLYVLILVVIGVVNGFLIPYWEKKNTNRVGYQEFVQLLQKKEVDTVKIDGAKIVFELKSNKDKSFITGYMDDPDLVKRLENSGAKYERKIPTESSPIMYFLLSYMLPFGVVILIFKLLSKNLKKGGMGLVNFGKSNARLCEDSTGVVFSDVAGQDEAKESLTEMVNFLNSPDKYSKIGAKMPRGALLVGPPGTGKTLLAKAVAGEAKTPFFSISGSEFVELYAGMGALRVRDLFKQAKEKAPCIVFIDEIDAIGKKRDGNIGGNDEREQTLNQLLSEMDGFENDLGIVVLAATNRPESLDKALLRPGRFDRRIPVELPDLRGRVEILKVHAKKIEMDSNIDFSKIAQATSGASGAELANIVNESALRAVKLGREKVIQEDLEESVEVVIAGQQRKNAVISDKEKKIISYHEVGHAIVAANGKNSAPVHKITIIPRTMGALGYTMQVDTEEKVLMSKEEAIERITTYTAGRAAEEIVFGSITSGASNDIEMATKIARAMVTRYGMSSEIGMVALETQKSMYLDSDGMLQCSPEIAAKIDKIIIDLISDCYEKSKKILNDNIDKLHEISSFLIERETITGEEFMDILNGEYKVSSVKAYNNDAKCYDKEVLLDNENSELDNIEN